MMWFLVVLLVGLIAYTIIGVQVAGLLYRLLDQIRRVEPTSEYGQRLETMIAEAPGGMRGLAVMAGVEWPRMLVHLWRERTRP